MPEIITREEIRKLENKVEALEAFVKDLLQIIINEVPKSEKWGEAALKQYEKNKNPKYRYR